MLTTSGIESARYRNQFSLETISRVNTSGTIFDDLDKIFFIQKIIPASSSAAWTLNYESYNPDSRLIRTRIAYVGILEFYPTQELVVNRIQSLNAISYLTGFFIRKR